MNLMKTRKDTEDAGGEICNGEQGGGHEEDPVVK